MEHEIEKTLFLAVTGEDRAQRIDSFIAAQIEDLTRSRVQELVKRGFVQVNGHSPKTSYRLKKGDLVTLTIPPVQPYALEPEPVDFTLVYEDPSLIVLNKPPGQPCQGSFRCCYRHKNKLVFKFDLEHHSLTDLSARINSILCAPSQM